MQKINNILEDGLENLQIVLDFDGTITDGISLLAIFRKEEGISREYVDKAYKLYDHYRPIELSSEVSSSEKDKQMTKWWQEHIELLIEYGLDKNHIQQLVQSKHLNLKKGIEQFFEFCYLKNIPIMIFSANLLGTESIYLVLERFNINFPNVEIHSNNFIFGENGKFEKIDGEIVHSENKDEHLIKHKMKRKNTILVGDNPSDAKMILDADKRIVFRVGVFDTTKASDSDFEKQKNTFIENFDYLTNDFTDILNLINK